MSAHAEAATDRAFESQSSPAFENDSDSLCVEALMEVMKDGSSSGFGAILESQLVSEAVMTGDYSSSAELASAVLASSFASAAFMLSRGDERFGASHEPASIGWAPKRKKSTQAGH
jgi:hypothetical protein